MSGLHIDSNVQLALIAMLVFFTLASFVLAFVTLTNALRLRNVLLTWKEGKLMGYPMFATLFMLFTAVLFFTAWWQGNTSYYTILLCYGILSVNWVISSYYMSKRYITDNGIVKNINDPSQTVAWKNIHDFIEHESETGYTFVFMYVTEGMHFSLVPYYRLELHVPTRKLHGFKKILNHKLGRRFHQSVSGESIIDQFDPGK